MSNELLLLLHLVCAAGFIFVSLKLGRVYLIVTFCLQVILSNLLVIKQVELFSLHVTCCEVYTISSIVTLNLLQEYHGKKAARSAVVALCFSSAFFIAMTQLHLLYTPSSYDTTQAAFETLLRPSPKVMLFSILIALGIARLDIELFALLKRVPFFKEKLSSRFGLLTLFTQFIDTALFVFIVLKSLIAHPSHLLLVGYLSKALIIVCMTPTLYFFKKWIPLERREAYVS